MNSIFQRAQAYQILALNDEMFKNGYISREEHDYVRHIQSKKLTNLPTPVTINPSQAHA